MPDTHLSPSHWGFLSNPPHKLHYQGVGERICHHSLLVTGQSKNSGKCRYKDPPVLAIQCNLYGWDWGWDVIMLKDWFVQL